LRDAKRREVVSFKESAMPARDGNSLVLTIDEVIQHITETEVDRIVELYKPTAVSIVLVVPKTGEILALANYPVFDPNNPEDVTKDFVRNRTITDSFEPGSVFKIVTASAALEENAVDFDTEVFCENGSYKVGKRILHDYRPYGKLKFREVIEKSSNIGTAKVAEILGKEKLAAYIEKFGFNNVTGIDLPGEVSGIMRDPSGWSYVDMTTVPMGQGIAVTNLQLVMAISAIANGGLLMRPYIVQKFINEEGDLIRTTKPEIIRRILSKKTSGEVRELLEGAVERGTGKQAKLSNFTSGGKTGTAQKVRPLGGYYKKKYIASFIGFAPINNPEIAIAVMVDDPKGKYFGGQVAAPAFKNIAEKVLSYMEIENDKEKSKKSS
ncbi:MAG: penicillin-binding transpeptidase domain-containing protein, partial [Candidatus Omnitrophota bacterium]